MLFPRKDRLGAISREYSGPRLSKAIVIYSKVMIKAILTPDRRIHHSSHNVWQVYRFRAAYLLTTTTARTVVVNAIAASSKPISLNFMAIDVSPPNSL